MYMFQRRKTSLDHLRHDIEGTSRPVSVATIEHSTEVTSAAMTESESVATAQDLGGGERGEPDQRGADGSPRVEFAREIVRTQEKGPKNGHWELDLEQEKHPNTTQGPKFQTPENGPRGTGNAQERGGRSATKTDPGGRVLQPAKSVLRSAGTCASAPKRAARLITD